MKEFVEKLISKLNERLKFYENRFEELSGTERDSEDWGSIKSYKDTIEIVKELEQEYNNGWIPCSERLPEEDKIVLLCTKDGLVRQGVRHISYEHNRYDLYGVTSTFWDNEVIAWQPLPEEYKEKGKSQNESL